MSDWQPIETAPKDKHKEIQLRGWYEPSEYAAKNGAVARWVYGEGSWCWGDTWSGILGKPKWWKDKTN
jgi:hypothetical protein